MGKRKETLEIEEKLRYMCQKRRLFGCEEVTIGFYHNGHGDEIVDFCTMDTHGIIRCYEIKVTLSDLKSKAKKSWYGHYNYLFVTSELYGKIYKNLSDYIPDYVGVAIPCSSSWSDGVEIRRKPKKQNLSQEQSIMMKESMIRSMNYKMNKFRDAADMTKVSELQSKLRKSEEKCNQYEKELLSLRDTINWMEIISRRYYDKDVCFAELVDDFIHEKLLLPEDIHLTLSERGKKRNEMLKVEHNEGKE